MEQAVNTFQHGLLMDTHPMNHGNDSLTDALNATLATMNGNEAILLNDMGNAKVDNAYLPAGYVPVGIKEHGGIIYVASYNPITNRSLLGSFPSPERRYNTKDLNIVKTFDFEELLTDSNVVDVDFCGTQRECLKTDEVIYNLTEKNIIRTGDKFAIWSNDLPTKKLSNYYNTEDGKVISPKNKLYTLQIGVINSLNEFVDITKTLGRWDNNHLIKYINGESDLYKFNDYYFICENEPESIGWSDMTIADRDLLKERQVKELNTYTYKLLGPLCVKAKLNHVESFSYNIYGLKIGNNKAELWIEGYITYNCPDGINSGGGSDDNYINYYDDSQLSNRFFDFKVDGQNKGVLLTDNEYKTKYDPTTNLYTVKQVLHIESVTGNDNKIDYFIGVKPCLDDELDGVYLRDLSNCGTIDISKLGSGTYELKEWRFTSNLTTKTSILVYNIEAYPKYGERLDHLEATFVNLDNYNNFKNVVKCNLPLNNGVTRIEFNWRDSKMFTLINGDYNYLLDRALYGVHTFEAYCSNSNDSPYPIMHGEDEALEFFLTTERMNSCFNPRSKDFIKDYGNPQGEENDETSERYTFELKKKIELITDVNLVDESTYSVTKKNVNTIGKTSDLSLEYTTTADINIINKSTISIRDLERLYPSYIALSPTANLLSILDYEKAYLINNNLFGGITVNSNGNQSININLDLVYDFSGLSEYKNGLSQDQHFVQSNKSITGTFEYKDLYKSDGKLDENVTISNGFVKLDANNFNEWFLSGELYGGVCFGTLQRTGPDDKHEIRVLHDSSGYTGSPNDDSKYVVVESRFMDDYVVFTDDKSKKVKDGEFAYSEAESSNYKEEIYEALNSLFQKEIFVFYFFNWGDHDKDVLHFTNNDPLTVAYKKETLQNGDDEHSSKSRARVWWRNSEGKWSLVKQMINKTRDVDGKTQKSKMIWSFLNRIGIFDQDIVYCMYKSISAYDAGIYVPDFLNQAYNNFYEIIIPFEGIVEINDCTKCISLLKGIDDKEIDKIGQIENIINYSNYEIYASALLNNNNEFRFVAPDKANCEKQFYIETKLKSSREFLDKIEELKTPILTLLNIYLENGQSLDLEGNLLHSKCLYKEYADTSGNIYLVKINLNNFQITEDWGREGIQVLVPNGKKGTPSIRNDHYYDKNENEHPRTILDYTGFYVIDSPILTTNP